MDIDRDLPIPVWRQLADILRAQIASGEIGPRLPGERTLEQQYGLSYKTVRRSIEQLRDEGLVVTVHGLGTFVKRDEDR